ncbi:MAG: lamin tail domain-containing protein [bacterium]|nr:lamin tail domain-containing protein [bacterium]
MNPRFMMPLSTALTLAAIALAGVASGQTTDLIISEYIEGSGNNKAIEIYNGTTDVVNLGAYAIDRYSNGSTSAVTIPLPAINLARGATHVIAYNLSDPALLALANQVDTNLNFNGNDAVVLTYGGSTVVDSFGRVGEDPGTAWTCTGGTTVNHTMRRLSSICTGDIAPGDAFNPCLEWAFFAVDTFSGLGGHVTDCGTVGDEPTSWSTLKATWR